MKKALQIGGIAAGAVLIGFGIAATVLGIKGGNTVNSNLSQEFITGTPDMTPAGIAPEVKAVQTSQQKIAAAQKKANVPPSQQYTFTTVEAPTCSVAGEHVKNGTSALCFAKYMRIHALGASSGLTYSQMGRYATANGAAIGTNDATQAVQKNGQPVSNSARDIWVTETALTTALNVSFLATQISLFSVVVGVALVLAGIGFIVLDWAALHRRRQTTVIIPDAPPLEQPKEPALV